MPIQIIEGQSVSMKGTVYDPIPCATYNGDPCPTLCWTYLNGGTG